MRPLGHVRVWDRVGVHVWGRVQGRARGLVLDRIRDHVLDRVEYHILDRVWDRVLDRVLDRVWARVWETTTVPQGAGVVPTGGSVYEELIGKHVIVRSAQSGVWCGVLLAAEGGTRKLRDARRAWSWTGAASCSGLAVEGPSGGKITSPVPLAIIEGTCETLSVTDAALARWTAIAAWKA